ncbi:PREDICTED: translation initiation factor IF-2-like [Lepidothrix coronata]|uniref:Translation initiation factor IF-2-like n=1 Tax=Lepidothrix coronata TaxID=321398 RepID=A0A6J0HPY5_9PASS|nr:PREDICTED: translation initiation factor IF-2-like [Lepidothrix coronata]
MPHSPPSRPGTAPCAGGGLPEGLCRGLGAGTPGVRPDQGAGQGTGSRERDPGRPRTRGKGPSDTALVPPPDHPSTSRYPRPRPRGLQTPPIPARLSRRRPITARLFNPAAVPEVRRRGWKWRWSCVSRGEIGGELGRDSRGCRSRHVACLGHRGRSLREVLAPDVQVRSRPATPSPLFSAPSNRSPPFPVSCARSAAARSRPLLHLDPRVPLRRRSRRLCFGIRRSRACAAAAPAGAVGRAGGRSAVPSRPGVLLGEGEGGGERAEAEQPLGAGPEGTAGFLGTGKAGAGGRGLVGPDAAGRWDWLGWHGEAGLCGPRAINGVGGGLSGQFGGGIGGGAGAWGAGPASARLLGRGAAGSQGGTFAAAAPGSGGEPWGSTPSATDPGGAGVGPPQLPRQGVGQAVSRAAVPASFGQCSVGEQLMLPRTRRTSMQPFRGVGIESIVTKKSNKRCFILLSLYFTFIFIFDYLIVYSIVLLL